MLADDGLVLALRQLNGGYNLTTKNQSRVTLGKANAIFFLWIDLLNKIRTSQGLCTS